MKENEDLMIYFPYLKESKIPEKEFMYGIFSTFRPDGIQKFINKRSPIGQDYRSYLIKVWGESKESISYLFTIKSK